MSATRQIAQARDTLLAEGVVLCIRFDDDAGLLESCRAAAGGGLRVLEITLTTPGALRAIEELAPEPDLLVGAGTVLSTDDVRRVAEAGGRFALSPVFDAQVVDAAKQYGLLAVPGAATPTEILAAHRHGASLIKVFPAAALGGPEYLKALRRPLPSLPLLPTSGPTAENLAAYFEAGASAVGVGAEVFAAGGDTASIETAAHRVRRAVDVARLSARARTRGAPKAHA